MIRRSIEKGGSAVIVTGQGKLGRPHGWAALPKLKRLQKIFGLAGVLGFEGCVTIGSDHED